MTYSLWRNGYRLADIVPVSSKGPPSMICGKVALAPDFADYEAIFQCPGLDRPGRPIVHGITHKHIYSNEGDTTTEVRGDGFSVTTISGRLVERPLVTHVAAEDELFEIRDDSGAVVPVDLILLDVWPFPEHHPSPDANLTRRWQIMIALAGSIPFPNESGAT